MRLKRFTLTDYACFQIFHAHLRKSSCYASESRDIHGTSRDIMIKAADILRSTPLARDYAKSFAAATGLPVIIETPGGFSLQAADIPECCRRMAAREKTCRKCAETHIALQGAQPKTARCFAGLTSSAIPVTVRGETVAYLHTGHAAVNGDAAKSLPGAPKLTRGQYEGALRLLELFSRQLAGNLPAATEAAPYPAIDRAAREIAESPGKNWRLKSLARQAKMHPAYFSEMFRRRLGLTLTRFIAGARTEKARRLLLHTDMQITEVAFASGFGSISQFNRVFRKETGMRPGDLRR